MCLLEGSLQLLQLVTGERSPVSSLLPFQHPFLRVTARRKAHAVLPVPHVPIPGVQALPLLVLRGQPRRVRTALLLLSRSVLLELQWAELHQPQAAVLRALHRALVALSPAQRSVLPVGLAAADAHLGRLADLEAVAGLLQEQPLSVQLRRVVVEVLAAGPVQPAELWWQVDVSAERQGVFSWP